MKIIKVPIEKCELWDKNPRGITKKDFDRLKRQIKKLGFYKPLIVCEEGNDYVVLGGNMRLRALKELGYKEVEVSVVDCRTEAEKIEYSLSDNDRVGYYEEDRLAELIQPYLDDFALEDYKVDLGESVDLKDLYERLGPSLDGEGGAAEEGLPENEIEVRVKKGEIYQLGQNRVMCGNSEDKKDLDKLLGDEKVSMILTDPPYGIDLDTDFCWMKGIKPAGVYDKIKGDDKPYDPRWLLEKFKNVKEIILWGADYYANKLPDNGSWLVWDKKVDENTDKTFGSAFELAWSKSKHKREIIRIKWVGLLGLGIEFDGKVGRWHPTQKPVKLAEWLMERYTKKGQVIVDLYLGAGWTVLAGEKLERRVFGMEIEERYVEITLRRWAMMTGVNRDKIKPIKT